MPTFDATDFDNAVSESGVVHESTANTDHTDASQLKQGYDIQNPYLSANLVGYWPLQEDSGNTAYDFSGGGYNLNVNGAGPGGTGTAYGGLDTSMYSFDGTDDTVQGSAPDLSSTSAYTFAGWIRLPDTSNADDDFDNTIVRWGDSDGLGVAVNLGGTVFVYTSGGNTNGQGSITVDNNTLHYFSAVIDQPNNTVRVSIDGVLDYEDTSYSDDSSSTTANFYIGNNPGGTDYYKGDIGPIFIFNKALSSSESQTLYDVLATQGSLTTQFKSV